MPLVNMSELLDEARRGDWALGSFSVADMEMVLGVLQAAEEEKSPVILQIAEVRLKNSPLELIGPLMVSAAENADVPVAVHFDHGLTYENIAKALDFGFSSVMFDGSALNFEENVKGTLEIASLAEEYGADVEAEIGAVGGSEDGSQDLAVRYTSPEEAQAFYRQTGVDALAVAIGNAHGNYSKEPHLSFDILEKIQNKLEIPLVLHGGTGLSAEDFKKCISLGIKKINIATATFDSVERAVGQAYKDEKVKGYYDLQAVMVKAAYENAKKHIKIFGSDGKA
ncbi:MAG: class II aldolase [Clostridiales bacterium]|jgi:fructose-bisphosphate aldolase class II|nr:class II aldolase [Clostridiales bacterium]